MKVAKLKKLLIEGAKKKKEKKNSQKNLPSSSFTTYLPKVFKQPFTKFTSVNIHLATIKQIN